MKINKNDISRSLPDSGVNEEFSIGPAKDTKEWKITKVVEQKAGDFLRRNCRLTAQSDFVLNSIFTYFIESTAAVIGEKSSIMAGEVQKKMSKMTPGEILNGFCIDFEHLFAVVSTYKYNEDSEKLGNINLKVLVHDDVPFSLQEFEEMLVEKKVEGSSQTMMVYPIKDEYQHNVIHKEICMAAASNLLRRCNITIMDTDVLLTTAMAFFVASIETMLQFMSIDNKTKMEFNIMEAFEIMIHIKGQPIPDEVQIRVSVGEAMKLNVKNDTITEDE